MKKNKLLKIIADLEDENLLLKMELGNIKSKPCMDRMKKHFSMNPELKKELSRLSHFFNSSVIEYNLDYEDNIARISFVDTGKEDEQLPVQVFKRIISDEYNEARELFDSFSSDIFNLSGIKL